MARPRKGEEKDRPKHLGFRVATWVHDGVQRLAEERGLPASEVAHDLLEIALGRFGIKPPKPGVEGSQPARSATRRSG
ncbi:MAG TPA: hypothetical protein VGF29_15855 [Hyphomicrobiaceae bacterium]|jgi:hypothetical protein